MPTALLVFAAVTLLPAPQTDPNAVREVNLANHYVALVETYRAGRIQVSLDELRSWRREDIDTALAALHSRYFPKERWSLPLTRAAVLLHTDLAVALVKEHEPFAAQWHLRTAERILRFPEIVEPADAFRRRWYLAAATAYQVAIDPFAAQELLAEARQLMPHDAELLAASGMAQEAVSAVPPEHPVPVTNRHITEVPRRARNDLEQAVRFFRESLALKDDPAVRLHLGRVMAVLGNRGALDVLQPLAVGDGPVAHLAWMFVGAYEHERRRFAEAGRAYEAAARAEPRSRVARIAWSRALQDAGQVDAARQVLADGLGAPEPPREPWSEYPIAIPADLLELWRPLRTEGPR
jgi:tetratricopeptide (TPR) repeat protein